MTNPVPTYSFTDQVASSQDAETNSFIRQKLLDIVPGAIRVEKANLPDDKDGTDWWVHILRRPAPLSFDCKVREEDCRKYNKDDLALETWAAMHPALDEPVDNPQKFVGDKRGWTLDVSKRTDFVLWLWKDTKRWCVFPFIPLLHRFIKNQHVWTAEYGPPKRQYTPYDPETGRGDYHSECIFVPRLVVWRSIYNVYGGEA